MITKRAFTVARSETAVTRWPPSSPAGPHPVDGAHRAVQHDVVTQFCGEQQGDLLHPADDALVQDEVLVGEVGEGSGGGGHQHGLQGGEGVGGLGQHAAGDEEADVVAGFLVRRSSARSQWWKEMVSSSRALGCAHGSVGPISAARASSRAMSLSISAAVVSLTGKESPV